MCKFFGKKNRNRRAFWKETDLYRVEPLVEETECWTQFSHVSYNRLAKTLKFSDLKGRLLYAKFILTSKNRYWKVYIVDQEDIDIVYVRSVALNPVQLIRR